MSDVVEVALGCTSWHQAQNVTDYLLGRRLIASAETLAAKEIQLLLTTTHDNLGTLEEELKLLLQADVLPLLRLHG